MTEFLPNWQPWNLDSVVIRIFKSTNHEENSECRIPCAGGMETQHKAGSQGEFAFTLGVSSEYVLIKNVRESDSVLLQIKVRKGNTRSDSRVIVNSSAQRYAADFTKIL